MEPKLFCNIYPSSEPIKTNRYMDGALKYHKNDEHLNIRVAFSIMFGRKIDIGRYLQAGVGHGT